MHEDKNCSKRECHSVSSSGTGIFFFCTFDNTEQRPQRSETCLGPHMKPAAELATHSVLQSFNHYPNHMVVLALSGDFPPPVPHVPKEDTHKIDLASAKVLISLFLWALKLWCGSLFSLTYKKLFERGKKLQWGFFLLSRDTMLKICCISLLWQNNPYWITDPVFLEHPPEWRKESMPKTLHPPRETAPHAAGRKAGSGKKSETPSPMQSHSCLFHPQIKLR